MPIHDVSWKASFLDLRIGVSWVRAGRWLTVTFAVVPCLAIVLLLRDP